MGVQVIGRRTYERDKSHKAASIHRHGYPNFVSETNENVKKTVDGRGHRERSRNREREQ